MKIYRLLMAIALVGPFIAGVFVGIDLEINRQISNNSHYHELNLQSARMLKSMLERQKKMAFEPSPLFIPKEEEPEVGHDMPWVTEIIPADPGTTGFNRKAMGMSVRDSGW
jgi:hypothetical protein